MYIFKNRQNIYKRKFQNKAQTSIFVAVGVIMFIAVILGFYIYSDIRTAKIEEEAKISDLSLQAKEIEKFVNDCIKKVSFDGLKKIGQTGGYIEVPTLINLKGTSYWYLDQVNIQPFLNQTQERLLNYINTNVPACIDEQKITQLGFGIEKGQIKTSIEFGVSDITIGVIYSIKLTKEKFTKEFSDFFNTFNIRYRAIFEAATEVNERLFDADFDIKDPLKKLGYLRNLDFDIAYKIPEADVMTFTITDKKSITPTNEFYTFSFVAKFGDSGLKKITDLQKYSATNPTFLPFTIYSVDKKAQLDISSGTTISLNGQSVNSISVEQTYPNEVITKDVPVYKQNDKILQRQDIKYVIDNPIYTFEPTGIIFNKFQKLTLYYDNETKANKGVGILMGKNGFWVPILSKHEPEQKRVFSNILGFTEFTAVNCASQQVKNAIAEHFFEPSGFCYVQLALSVIALAYSIYIGVLFGFSWPVLFLKELLIGGLTTIQFIFAFGSLALVVSSLTLSTIHTTTDVFYEKSPDNCQTFYPTCEQTIDVDKEEKDGTGKCIPDGSTSVAAGQAVNVCAQIKKCDKISKFLCKPCSVKCTASFY